jgi:hypothetical protein
MLMFCRSLMVRGFDRGDDRSSFGLSIDPCCPNVAVVKLNHINLPDNIMSTIESIVRELEKIPEPMQLSLLDFIRSLGSNYPVAATTQNETKLSDLLTVC